MKHEKNVLVIICDQLSATALSSYGNSYSHTPAIDSIANEGAVFDKTYCTCPLCQPSRASFWTSRYPHETNVRSNLRDMGFPEISRDILTLGDTFKYAGYKCIHFGKRHDYGALRGFELSEETQQKIERDDPAITYDYESYMDVKTTEKTIDFLKNHDREIPFLAVADLQNPHNICEYIGEHEYEFSEFTSNRKLPELPPNFDFDDIKNRPAVIQYMCCAHRRQRQTITWAEEDFRRYLYAYYFYLEKVDKQIASILNTLKENKLDKDTLIVFFADHGEGMAAHGLVTKYASFYEETNHVPLIMKGPGIEEGIRIKGLSSLLDIFPTLIDYCDIKSYIKSDDLSSIRGKSLCPSLKDPAHNTKQEFVCGEWHDEFSDYTVPGRMIVKDNLKYTVYKDDNPEELYDLSIDPYEKKNIINEDLYKTRLEDLRKTLAMHMKDSNDDFPKLEREINGSYRDHKLGFCYHEGISAVENYHTQKKLKENKHKGA